MLAENFSCKAKIRNTKKVLSQDSLLILSVVMVWMPFKTAYKYLRTDPYEGTFDFAFMVKGKVRTYYRD